MQTIDINKQHIYEYVTTLTGTIGRQKDAYDKFVCLPDNYPVLDRFMDTAIAIVEASLWRRLADSHNLTLAWPNEQDLSVKIQNNAFPARLRGTLSTNIRLALAYILAGMWLQGIDAELYGHYAELSDRYIDNAAEIAAQKTISDVTYSQPAADNVSMVSPDKKTGRADIVQDLVSSDLLNKGKTGEQPLEDCCINKHSAFDDATLFRDGSVFVP